jgi:hypothetical protein
MSAVSSLRISNVIGFDDAPFTPEYTDPVKVVGDRVRAPTPDRHPGRGGAQRW